MAMHQLSILPDADREDLVGAAARLHQLQGDIALLRWSGTYEPGLRDADRAAVLADLERRHQELADTFRHRLPERGRAIIGQVEEQQYEVTRDGAVIHSRPYDPREDDYCMTCGRNRLDSQSGWEQDCGDSDWHESGR